MSGDNETDWGTCSYCGHDRDRVDDSADGAPEDEVLLRCTMYDNELHDMEWFSTGGDVEDAP